MRGIIICNLGTPREANTPAVRQYLAQFLSDQRVIPLPRWLWLPILHGYILRTRPQSSTKKYRQIWTPDGSPLLVWQKRQARVLQRRIDTLEENILVDFGMRYGEPSIESTLNGLVKKGVKEIVVIPNYPQYSKTTTLSVHDAVANWLKSKNSTIHVNVVESFFSNNSYIEALALSIEASWKKNGRGDKLLFSFHSIPQRGVDQGDPYLAQCQATTQLLAKRLQLSPDDYRIGFQSKLGKSRWLEPAIRTLTTEFASKNIAKLDVVCPGFSCDCLETLEEINITERSVYQHLGGRGFHYIPCLNDDPNYAVALAQIAMKHFSSTLFN